MTIEIYYFSGTGNSLHIGKELINNLGEGKLISIVSKSNKDDVKTDADIVGIVYPVYFLNIPEIVVEFIKKLKTKKDCYMFVISNCGSLYGGSHKIAGKLLAKGGNNLSSAFNISMPDNSIEYPTAKQKHEPMIEQMKIDAKNIAEAIINSEIIEPNGSTIYSVIGGKLLEIACVGYLGFKDMKVDKETCNSCSMCEKICPVGNIKMVNGTPQWGKECTMCFACINNCKKESITYRRQKNTTDYRYTNSYVSAKELIEGM